MKPGKALHRDFGIEVEGVDLSARDIARHQADLRHLFEVHSLLLFRDQELDDAAHIRLASLFGPLEDRGDFEGFRVSKVTNVDLESRPKSIADADRNRLNLEANMLWHTDSIFMPVPALANILHAKVLPETGGNTELVSTRAGWRRMDPALKAKIQGKTFLHRYSHSRRKIDPELAEDPVFTKWPDTRWKSLWRNPITGEEGVYVASHTYGVDGMTEDDGAALVHAVIAALTGPESVYSHEWRIGDVLIWDERATMHRGTPWPYHQPRTLTSICVSVTEADGLLETRG